MMNKCDDAPEWVDELNQRLTLIEKGIEPVRGCAVMTFLIAVITLVLMAVVLFRG